MESQNLSSSLTEDQWRASERLSDLLAETVDLQRALQIGLEVVVSTLGRPGGALFLPRFCEHVSQDWTMHQSPDEWNRFLGFPASPLLQVTNEVMHTGQPAAGRPELGLAAAFPILSSKRNLGVLLVSGPVIPREEYPRWLVLLRPIARFVMLHAAASGNLDGIPNYLELMKSRNTLRAMFDSLPISIYIIDHTYNLVAINYSRASRINEEPRQVVGHKCYEKLYGLSHPCPGCRAAETFRSGQNTQRMNRDWLDHEKFIEWEISTFPIQDEKNLTTQTIVIEQDVTEKRNLEANLVQSEKLAAVGQLAAGVAHEINNPLTAIIANAQILRREVPPENEDLLDSVKLIEMAGTRASQVVRNLLGIARKEKYELEPVDLNETLQNSLSLVQHELIGRPILVDLSLGKGLPRVLASQDQLQGVWINLILNAIDAIDKETGQVSIASAYTGKEFQVTIRDNGKGISAEHLPRVFEPFFTTKSPGRGTGLGLSVCMRVIRQHGGIIKVESEMGHGTLFKVILPGPK